MIDFLIVVMCCAILWWLFPHIKKSIKEYFFNRHMSDVREYMLGYRRRCRGNNRFVVTKETLQDVFREYDSNMIDKMWLKLVEERIIQQDPMDNEWCIR